MKTIPAALEPTFQRAVMRLATCMRIVRTDGAVYCFTTSAHALTINAELYLPAASFNPSDVSSNANLNTDDLEIEGLIADESINEDDLRAGRWDHAQFRIFQVDWSDTSLGEKKVRKGHLGKVSLHRQTFITELLGLMNALSTAVGQITQVNCRNNLGDAKCKVDMTGRVVTGTIATCSTDFVTLTDAARTEANATFDEGVITFTSGSAIGLAFEVRAYLVGTWTTKLPIPYDVTGASYSMSEGCIRTHAVCRDRFSNVVNFNGEPWLRGQDVGAQVGRHT